MILMKCDECGEIMAVKDALLSGYVCDSVVDGIAQHICHECQEKDAA